MMLGDQLKSAYEGKVVLVTGHTGFKGSWLSEWLVMLGARVVGISLPPSTEPSLFEQLQLARRVEHHVQDVRDLDGVVGIIEAVSPDYMFHLAAQPLVRLSYSEPVETFDTNVMGTTHVLQALARMRDQYEIDGRACAAVFVTTDKCYANQEWAYAYRENDALGGHDPYSASKAAAEIAIASFRQSFFGGSRNGPSRIGVSSARAGNVIGGGDWALDRIIPDCVRALQIGQTLEVRNPGATRPWQHVLESLSGYLTLAARMRSALESRDATAVAQLGSAFNFGSAVTSNHAVQRVVQEFFSHWPGDWRAAKRGSDPHEADRLNLAWDKAFHLLGWRPSWGFEETIERTARWYRAQHERGAAARTLTQADIQEYQCGRT